MAHRREGDWDCTNCGDMNFASRHQCRKCNTPKATQSGGFRGGGFGGGGGYGYQGSGFQGGGGYQHGGRTWNSDGSKPGDWYCPSCNDLNFASREVCRKCGSPHPPFSDPTVGTKPGDWFCPNCGDLNFASRLSCRKCNTAHPGGVPDSSVRVNYFSNVKPGDWNCPNCNDLNFASRQVCRMCNTARPDEHQILGVKPGDWFCTQCNDLNFVTRTHCRKCSAPRPDDQGEEGEVDSSTVEEDGLGTHLDNTTTEQHRTNIERIEQMSGEMD